MKTGKQITNVLAVVGLVLALGFPAQAAVIIEGDPLIPAGLVEGDTFQLAFLSMGLGPDATSYDIGVYNTFVTEAANSTTPIGNATYPTLIASLVSHLGADWFAIVSTGTGDGFTGVNAKDNAVCSGPVYDVNGLKLFNDAADMWNGAFLGNYPVRMTISETGVLKGNGSGREPITGTQVLRVPPGTAAIGQAGGRETPGQEYTVGGFGKVAYGACWGAGDSWTWNNSNNSDGEVRDTTQISSYYALSETLTIAGPVYLLDPGVAVDTDISATGYVTLGSSNVNSMVTCYWAESDQNQVHTGWLGTNTLNHAPGLVTPFTISGLTADTSYVCRFYATNSTLNRDGWSAPVSFTTTTAGEWDGSADDLWSISANWHGNAIPDTGSEPALFRGNGAGDVDLNGSSYTIQSLLFSAGDYTLIDTNAIPGSISADSLTNSGGDNTISVGMTISGIADVSGGKLTATGTNDFSATRVLLSGGTLAADSITSTPITVTANSAVAANSGTAHFGALTVTNDATLTSSGEVRFQKVDLAANATDIGFDVTGNTTLTATDGLDGAGASLSIVKTGDGNLILDRAGINLGSADFDVQAGALVGVNATAFGDAPLVLNGGTLALSSPGGDIVYDKALPVSADSTLTAGMHGSGVNGPVTVAFGSLGNDITVSSGTLTVNTTDNYTLELRGNQTGNMNVAGGQVSLATTSTNLGSVTLSDGTLTVNNDLEVVALISAGGTFVQSGPYDLMVSSALTLGANLDMSAANLNVSNATVTVNSGYTLTDDVDPMVADSWIIYGAVNVPGAIAATTKFTFEPTSTIANQLTGSGYLHAGDADNANGYVALTASNSYAGKTSIERAVLQADEGWGVPINSLIEFNQNDRDQTAIFETSGTFERTIANSAGNNVYWSNNGGFSALGGDLVVTLNSGATLVWGDSATGLNSKTLQFGSTTADSKVELTNPLDLGTSQRSVQICDNTSTTGDFVRLSGNITGSANNQSLRFNENSGNNFYGALVELTGSNNYSQRTHIDDATVFALPGAGLSPNSRIYFSGNNDNREAILMSTGQLELTINNDNGAGMYVSWQEERGGFAAKGGALTIDLTREDLAASPLDWSASDNGFAGRQLQLNSRYADSLVEIVNDIELDDTRYAYVFDNDQTDQDIAKLSGTISQDGSDRILRKRKLGTLWLTGANTYAGRTYLDDGAVRAVDGVGLPTNSQLYFEADSASRPSVLESSGTLERDIGNTAGHYVYWEGNGGGFAAYGGPLSINLESDAKLLWGDSNIGFNNRNLQMGSRTANDVVTFENDIDGQNGGRNLYAFDNPYSTNDYIRFTGELTGFNQFYLRGDANALVVIEDKLWTRQDSNSDKIETYGGTLKIAAGATMVSGKLADWPVGMQEIYIRDAGNMIINGSVTSSYVEVENDTNYSRKLSGSGSLWIRDRCYVQGSTSTIAPGDNSVGTMSFTFHDSNEKFELSNSAIYEWELGNGSSDLIAIEGNLDLDTWILQLTDAGGSAIVTDELDLFTYTGTKAFDVVGDVVQNVTINTNSLDAVRWDASGAVVKFDESSTPNRVYLTGLAVEGLPGEVTGTLMLIR